MIMAAGPIGSGMMLDLLYVLIVLACFVVVAAYARIAPRL